MLPSEDGKCDIVTLPGSNNSPMLNQANELNPKDTTASPQTTRLYISARQARCRAFLVPIAAIMLASKPKPRVKPRIIACRHMSLPVRTLICNVVTKNRRHRSTIGCVIFDRSSPSTFNVAISSQRDDIRLEGSLPRIERT